jgi:hypothetical protein
MYDADVVRQKHGRGIQLAHADDLREIHPFESRRFRRGLDLTRQRERRSEVNDAESRKVPQKHERLIVGP